ncbi:unnamed protein product [Orchesella dallaii]|uniref:Odorant receptor n=1 Tax=Orchesella dallaii TaxID=48710 RepID=A0ABP1RLU0_9HEXA
MATPLVQQSLTANELTSKYLGYSKFILRWNTKKNMFESSSKISVWHFTTGIAMTGFYSAVMLVSHIMQKNDTSTTHIIDEQHQAILTLFNLDWIISTGLNYCYFKWHVDMIEYSNRLFYYQKHYMNREIDSEFDLKKIYQEVLKLIKGQNCDLIGLMLLYVVHFLSIVAHFSAVVLGLIGVDPYSIAGINLIPKEYEGLRTSGWFSLITFPFFLIYVMEACRTLRTTLLLGITMTQITITCIQDIFRNTAVDGQMPESIRLYQLLYIVHLHYGPCGNLVAVLMGIGYFIGASTGAISLVGFRFMHPAIYIMFPLIWLVVLIAMLVALPYAERSYELTRDLIKRWQYMVASYSGKNAKFYRMKVRTLRQIGFKCGSVGNICKETKTIYLGALLCDTNNILLLFNSA